VDISRIYIDEISKYLHLNDSRTIQKWARANNVSLIKEDFVSTYAVRTQFMNAFDRKSIEAIKKASPDNWQVLCAEYDDKAKGSLNPEYAAKVLADLCKNAAPEAYSQVPAPSDAEMSKHSKNYINKPQLPQKQPNHLSVQDKQNRANHKQVLKLSTEDNPVTGLHIFCNACKKRYIGECRNKTGVCNPTKMRYRLEINTEATGRLFVTKPFNFVFQESVAKERAQKERDKILTYGGKIELSSAAEILNEDYELLPVLIKKHLSYLKDEGTDSFDKKQLAPRGIETTERIYKFMLRTIDKLGLNSDVFRVHQLNERLPLPDGRSVKAAIYDAITNINSRAGGKIKNATINGYLKAYRYLFAFGIDECNLVLNPFSTIPLKPENAEEKIRIMTKDEFLQLEKMLLEKEQVRRDFKSGGKNFYREYTWDMIRLALFTGFRSLQVANLKFSNILMADNGDLINGFLKSEDYKINNMFKYFKEEEKRYSYIRIGYDLGELLMALSFERYKGTDTYIIQPNISNRKTLIKQVSDAYVAYMKKICPKKMLRFKDMRKTHISQMVQKVGLEKTKAVWHRDKSVTKNNYTWYKSRIPTADEFPRIYD